MPNLAGLHTDIAAQRFRKAFEARTPIDPKRRKPHDDDTIDQHTNTRHAVAQMGGGLFQQP